MARLTDTQREHILADFHIGKSQNWLAKEYECSPATINKICKGVIPKYKDKVNSVVAIKSELSNESEYQSECFDKEVNDKLRRANLAYGASEKILQRVQQLADKNSTYEKVSVGDGVQQFEPRELNSTDLKNMADTVDKTSLTLGVNQRHANSQIQVTNTNTQQSLELNQEIVSNTLKNFEDEY